MATTKSPAGVNGKNREAFLSLTEAQKETYLYHFHKVGRLAAHCYKYATGEWA